MLATLGPIADELYVYPAVPIQKGFEEYAISFAIPVATPGVVAVSATTMAWMPTWQDKPFSSRFDEQDAVIIFDDVLVPWGPRVHRRQPGRLQRHQRRYRLR